MSTNRPRNRRYWSEIPVMVAANKGNITLLKELVQNGEDLQERDSAGETAVHWAAVGGYTDVLEYLKNNGLPLDDTDVDGYSPAHIAALYERTDCLQWLINEGVNIETKNNKGKSPAHIAAERGSTDCLQLLINAGAIMTKNNNGHTPMDILKKNLGDSFYNHRRAACLKAVKENLLKKEKNHSDSADSEHPMDSASTSKVTKSESSTGSTIVVHSQHFKQSVADHGSVHCAVVQCLPLGLPRAGKTSMFSRLLDKRPEGNPTTRNSPGYGSKSTNVLTARRMIQVKIDTIMAGDKWEQVKSLEDEIAIFMRAIYTQRQSSDESSSTSSASVDTKVLTSKPLPPTAMQTDTTLSSATVQDRHRLDKTDPQNRSTELDLALIDAIVDRIKGGKVDLDKIQVILDKSLTIFYSDCGGQPEFHEVLPALVAGPTIFMLVFSLCQPLDSLYKVRYEFSDNDVISYDSTCTVKEVLMQCLCSIQSFHEAQSRSYDQLKSEAEMFANFTPPPTNVLAVATHSDLVDESEITKIDESLQKSVSKTTLKEKGMIEFATPNRLIIPIDNYNEDDGPKLRKTFDRVVNRKVQGVSPYKVEIPTHWLGLELYLRQLESSVVSYTDCLTLGGKLGIGSKELVSCLWFLHHQMGTIRHYKDAKELEGIVITKPNVLFRAVTEFITSTFDLDNVDHAVQSSFRSYGLFKEKEVQSIFEDNKDDLCLTLLQFVSLLEHLKIIGPAHNPEYDYFLPCALAHAPPAAADGSQLAEYDPLLVAFPGGFVPKGVFSSTLADLCQNDWEIECDDMEKPLLYRDQATMIAYDHSIVMKARPKYLEFTVEYKTNGSFCKIFNTVLTQLDKTLNSVLECLGYSSEFSYGFRCQITQRCKDQIPAHFAEALVDESKQKCLITKRKCDLEGTRNWWFCNTAQESSSSQPGSTCKIDLALIPKQTERSASTTESVDGSTRPPSIDDAYDCLKEKSAHWDDFARELRVSRNIRKQLKQQESTSANSKLETVLEHWIEGETCEVSWRRIIQVLGTLKMKDTAREVLEYSKHSTE